MLVDHADAVEADLWRYYQRDLLDLWRGALTLRQLLVLVRHLPMDSATVKALEPAAAWSTTDYLLAAAVDAVNEGNWLYACAHSEKAPDRPVRLARPADAAAPQQFASPSEVLGALSIVNGAG